MKVIAGNIRTLFPKACLLLGLLMMLLFFSNTAFSQNTKGDRPSNRENRFRIPSKKAGQKQRNPRNKRVRSKGKSLANSGDAYTPRRRARGGERAGRPVKPVFRNKPSDKQRAWTGDISGRRLRTKDASSSGAARNVFPQRGRYVRKSIPEKQRAWKGTSSGSRVTVRSRSGKTNNVFSQRSRYVHNTSKPRRTERVTPSRFAQVRVPSDPRGTPPGRKKKIVPRSASRSFIARKSINVYAHFPRPKRKPERAYTKDIAGRPLRMRNYQTPRPEISAPTFKPYSGRKRVGDRPYTGPAAGKYRSATRPGERAWTGDIAKRRIRHRDRTSKRSIEGRPVLSGGFRSATRPGETRPGLNPLPGKAPGRGADRIGRFQGNLKQRRGFSNQGEEFTGTLKRRRGFTNQGQGEEFSGNLKRRRGFTNQGEEFSGNLKRRRGFSNQGEEFTGNIKARRPLKGGGSVSGKLWNNRGSAIATRIPSSRAAAKVGGYPGKIKRYEQSPGFNNQGEGYTGNIKTRRPQKGGGSVSGKLWNNDERAIAVRVPKENRAPSYQGNIKARRPQKGGGSVSGTLWNNNETPIPVRTPPDRARKEAGYPGNIKMFEQKPGFSDQGEEFTGHIRLSRFKKNYIQNKNAAEESILKKRPSKTTYDVDGLQVRVQRRDYVKNKNAAEDALLKLKPTRATYQVGELQVKVKQYRYIRNPNSAEEALKVREPGKAFARATDYQGNIKMQKFRLFEKNRELHPDARFVRTNKNNVADERDALTNFKLWWARLFKKQETQPDHLKEKGKKPRYDKGEQGLWYE